MPTPKTTGVEALEDYTLKLNYETGEIKFFNVLPYISGAWYEELNGSISRRLLPMNYMIWTFLNNNGEMHRHHIWGQD
jgi:hypothetical protein